jgi:hypothetical protein
MGVIGVILRVVAFVLFVVAGVNETLLNQPPADLVAFGLAAWVLAVLLDGVDVGRLG